MANQLFNTLNGGKQQPQQINPMQMIQQLQSNPVGFLKNAGYTPLSSRFEGFLCRGGPGRRIQRLKRAPLHQQG